MNKIFSYGTLDRTRFFSDLFRAGEIRYVGKGKIRAKLYDLGEYPGAVEDKESYVHGRVYEVKNIERVLPMFDEYEEFHPNKPETSLFIRKDIWVTMENGESLRAFVYLYNKAVERKKAIPTGIWDK